MKATKSINVVFSIYLVACLTLFCQTAYAGIAGQASFVNGSVQITNAEGKTRNLVKGDSVYESDTIITAKGASAQIKLLDGGLVAVRPDSQLKFDSFVFTGDEGKDKSFFSLLRGGFRAITGLIGQKNKANYRIATAGSTIGVRGTDHETFVVMPGSELAATVPVGTYNKVNVGETVMTTDKGTINILPNQMGYSAAADQIPQLQPINLNIFTAVPSPVFQTKGVQPDGKARERAVVDHSIRGQSAAPENAVPKNPTIRPITEDRGPYAPPRVF